MLDLLILILILAWLGGFALHAFGGFVHLILVVAVIVLVIRLIQGRQVL